MCLTRIRLAVYSGHAAGGRAPGHYDSTSPRRACFLQFRGGQPSGLGHKLPYQGHGGVAWHSGVRSANTSTEGVANYNDGTYVLMPIRIHMHKGRHGIHRSH
jgi:hypothetical protein